MLASHLQVERETHTVRGDRESDGGKGLYKNTIINMMQ